MASDSQPPKREVTATLGQIIDDRYRITAFIGDGGMGSVYRAEHLGIRRPVAIKLLHREYANQPGFAERFEREAMTAGRLDHPNCVAVTDFGELESGTLYLVMELVSGKTLGQLLREHEYLPVPRAVHIAKHALAALGHAHAAGIVHRDVKPDNIILVDHQGDRDFAKLLDFGIAKLVGEAAKELDAANLTQVGTTVGTPKYMPPEQAFGKEVDSRADLYSLSVVLFMMLTGRPPFEADEVIDLLMQHASRPPPRLADASPGREFPASLEAAVRKGLAKKQGDRFTSASEFGASLDAALDDYHADAATPRAPRPEAEPRLSHPGVIPQRAKRPLELIGLRAPVLRRAPKLSPRQWAVVGGCGILLISIIAAIAAGDPEEAPKNDSPALGTAIELFEDGANILSLKGPSGLAVEAKKLNRAGQYQRVLEITSNRDLDGFAHLEAGRAHSALEHDREALEQYLEALKMTPSLREDTNVFKAARAGRASRSWKTKGIALEILVRFAEDSSATDELLELAGESKRMDVRKRMRAVATELGLAERINLVRSHALDMVQEKRCEDRREALLELERLGDPRAVPAIEKARYRMRGGVLGIGDKNTNSCLKEDAKRIAAELAAKSSP